MEPRFLQALERLLDATAFENVGHMRDFEELLQRSQRAPERWPNEEKQGCSDVDVANELSFRRLRKGGP